MMARLTPAVSSALTTVLCALTVAVALFGSAAPASAQANPFILGTWKLVWEGARDNYTGDLRVAGKTGDTVFKGKLTLVKSDGTKVTEDASITVTGNEVRIECSNPSVTPWNPDRFYVVRKGNRLEGYSLDTAGQRGRKIVFTRT